MTGSEAPALAKPLVSDQAEHSDRTERGDQTHRHLLEVAALAFARKGYAGTSLNDLIKESGLTKGGFYFHFASKEALALAVVRDKQGNWVREVTAAALQQSRGVDQLSTVAQRLCDLFEQEPSFGCVGKLCKELSADPNFGPAIGRSFFTAWVQMVASFIRRGQQEGDIFIVAPEFNTPSLRILTRPKL